MRDPDRLLVLIREWVQKAEEDFLAAVNLVVVRPQCPISSVCYHVQQCVEKYFKTILILHDMDFPRTHDIEELVELFPRGIKVSLTITEQRRFTEYATGLRYPSEVKPATLAEARKSVSLMRKIRREVRRMLPKAALQQKKK
jgi:HEPN domain-containing protein